MLKLDWNPDDHSGHGTGTNFPAWTIYETHPPDIVAKYSVLAGRSRVSSFTLLMRSAVYIGRIMRLTFVPGDLYTMNAPGLLKANGNAQA
ncbi:hypothetical protein VTN77DRAFT_594 [Rasamsonia byssochlamydoides]|uniref:uncharacterized protein n=1 Tax=Rasamsonia byssochlamydoides TaxID=89139 RepID=UPI003743F877